MNEKSNIQQYQISQIHWLHESKRYNRTVQTRETQIQSKFQSKKQLQMDVEKLQKENEALQKEIKLVQDDIRKEYLLIDPVSNQIRLLKKEILLVTVTSITSQQLCFNILIFMFAERA